MSTRGFVLRRNISGQRSLVFFKDDFTKISYRDQSQIINELIHRNENQCNEIQIFTLIKGYVYAQVINPGAYLIKESALGVTRAVNPKRPAIVQGNEHSYR